VENEGTNAYLRRSSAPREMGILHSREDKRERMTANAGFKCVFGRGEERELQRTERAPLHSINLQGGDEGTRHGTMEKAEKAGRKPRRGVLRAEKGTIRWARSEKLRRPLKLAGQEYWLKGKGEPESQFHHPSARLIERRKNQSTIGDVEMQIVKIPRP